MKLSLRQIEIFLNVVKLGHLTQVAKGMGIGQSAVSMSIKELENALGHSLFDRINKKLVLNEHGRTFHKEVEPLYKRLEDIEHEFQNVENKGTVRIGASTTIVDYLMPSIICQYINQYPDVKIQLKEGNTKHIASMIKEGELDIAFVENSVKDSMIVSQDIGSDELIVVTANSKYRTGTYSISQLMQERWVLREEGSSTRETFLEYIKGQEDDINIFLELGHTESIKSILRNGKTFTCISKLAVEEELINGTLYQVILDDFQCHRSFSAIYHKEKFHSDLFIKFIEFSTSIIGQKVSCDMCGEESTI